MAAHGWALDAPTGTYRNHAISNRLLFASVGKTRLLPFTQVPDSGLGKHAGETLNLFRVTSLAVPTDASLSEDIRVPIDKVTMTGRTITVSEHGRGVEYTNLNEQLSAFRPSSYLQKLLIQQMEFSLDRSAGAAFQSTDAAIIFIPTSATGGEFETNGTPATLASNEFTFAHCGLISDYLAGDIHCPPWMGDEYMGVSTRLTLRGLKNDNLLQAVHMYLRDGDFFFRGEIGKTENIRWIEVNVETTLSNSAGSSSTIGEGMVFGDEAVARVEVESPHLRANPNYMNDFGRTHAVAWYGIYAFATWYDVATDGFARIVRIGSS